MTKERYLRPFIADTISEKMALLGGPRQVGKTTLALSFLSPPAESNKAYLNWDRDTHRHTIMEGSLPPRAKIVVLDEIHKYARWRNLLKGLYDTTDTRFIVTGSARLDHYRKGGDSMFGRFRYCRLHPFTLGEISKRPTASDLETLLRFGGFPEPLHKASDKAWRLWRNERRSLVIREDLRDLEHVREISLVERLLEMLPERVGSPLSVGNLRENLDVAHETAERWITILENLYMVFRIPPYGPPRTKAVKKEQKLYFWDHSDVPFGGFRFENLVASQLLKYCHFLEDTEGYRMELRFLRDVERREIDFVVMKEGKPAFAVECKSGEKSVSPAIRYFKQRTPIPAYYQVHLGTDDFVDASTGARILPFVTFCRELAMP